MVMIAFEGVCMIVGRRIDPMPNPVKSLFMAHPEALNESYSQHMGHAMSYAGRLFAASFCAFMHGIFPFLFEKTASNAIKAMHAEMMARGAMKPQESAPRILPAD
jgi:hypothetical protein